MDSTYRNGTVPKCNILSHSPQSGVFAYPGGAGLAFCISLSKLCTSSGGVCYTSPQLEVAYCVQRSYGAVLSVQRSADRMDCL